MKLKNFLQISFLALTLFQNILFSENRNNPMAMFDRILLSIQHTCESNVEQSDQVKEIIQEFYALKKESATKFREVYKKLRTGHSFIVYTEMQTRFLELCRDIKNIDEEIVDTEKFNVGNFNCLMSSVEKFKNAAYSELICDDESEEKQIKNLYEEIEGFYESMDQIYKKSYQFIGTLSERVLEFARTHWQFGAGFIGATAAAKIAYDLRNYEERYKDSKSLSLYQSFLCTLLLMGLGSFVFSNLSMYEHVFTREGAFTRGPVGRDENSLGSVSRKRNHGEIIFWDAEGNGLDNRNVTIVGNLETYQFDFDCHMTTLPCVRQSGWTCGYHALFNAANMVDINNYPELTNRAVCIGHVSRWQKITDRNYDIHEGEMQVIFRTNDQFLRERILNGQNELRENISIIELSEFIRQLDNLRGTVYNVQYDEAQHLGIYERQDLRRVVRKFKDRSGNKIERHEYLFTGEPSDLIPGIGDMGMPMIGVDIIDRDIIRNINNFRNNGAAQTIILNTGGHWIVVRLETVNGRDHITVADSSGPEGSCWSHIKRLHYLFRIAQPPDIED